jgi:hypothetical protein
MIWSRDYGFPLPHMFANDKSQFIEIIFVYFITGIGVLASEIGAGAYIDIVWISSG